MIQVNVSDHKSNQDIFIISSNHLKPDPDQITGFVNQIIAHRMHNMRHWHHSRIDKCVYLGFGHSARRDMMAGEHVGHFPYLQMHKLSSTEKHSPRTPFCKQTSFSDIKCNRKSFAECSY